MTGNPRKSGFQIGAFFAWALLCLAMAWPCLASAATPLGLRQSVNAQALPPEGGTLAYALTLTNTGAEALENITLAMALESTLGDGVTVSGAFDAGESGPQVEQLAPGQSVSVPYRVVLEGRPEAQGVLRTHLTAVAENPATEAANTFTFPGQPSLSITYGPMERLQAGDVCRVPIKVENTGEYPLSDICLTAIVQAAGEDLDCVFSNPSVKRLYPAGGAGPSQVTRYCSFKLPVASGGGVVTLTVNASTTYAFLDGRPAQRVTAYGQEQWPISPAPGMSITLYSVPPTPLSGEAVTLIATVRNTGGVPLQSLVMKTGGLEADGKTLSKGRFLTVNGADLEKKRQSASYKQDVLEPGDGVTLTYRFTMPEDGGDYARVFSELSASAQTAEGVPVTAFACKTLMAAPEASGGLAPQLLLASLGITVITVYLLLLFAVLLRRRLAQRDPA